MLVGRAKECGAIAVLLEDARRGVSGLLVLVGEPGVGKTALLTHAHATADDFSVADVAASRTEADLPYSGLDQLLRNLSQNTHAQGGPGRPAPPTASPVTPTDRFLLGLDLLHRLATEAEQRPVLVMIDDAHWLDPDSIGVIVFALRRLHADRVAFLVTVHDRDLPPMLDLPEQRQLRIPGLDREAVGQLLARDCARPAAASLIETLAAQTGGNPFAIREVAGRLTPRQLDGIDPLTDVLPPPQAAQRMLAARCGELDHSRQLCLGLLAITDGEEVGVAAAAAGLLGIDVDLMDWLESVAVVSFLDDHVRFAHPLLRWAAVAQQTPAARRRAHAAIAEVLTAPQRSAHRAYHRAAAVVGYDELVAADLEQLAPAALRAGGYSAAASVLRRSAALTAPGPARAARLHSAAELARTAGRADLAIVLLSDAQQQIVDPLLLARIEATLGELQLFAGQAGLALTTLRRAASASSGLDPTVTAQSMANAAVAAFLAGRPIEAVEIAFTAQAAGTVGGASTALLCDVIIGSAFLHIGDIDDALRHLDAAWSLADRAADDPRGASHVIFAGLALLWTGDPAAASRLINPVLAQLRRSNGLGLLPAALYAAAQIDLYVGRLTAAYGSAAQAAGLAEATGDRLWSYLSTGCLALVEALRGNGSTCREQVSLADKLSGELDLSYPRDTHDALGALSLALGDPRSAIRHLTIANQPGDRQGPVLGRPSSPDLVQAMVQTGAAVPDQIQEEVDRQTSRQTTSGLVADAWRCRGLLRRGTSEATAAYHTALDIYLQLDLPLRAARCRLCLGEELRRTGQRTDARRELRTALRGFEDLGAALWADRVRAELRAGGDTTTLPPHLAQPLTGQEIAVAHAVAGGATNREAGATLFLSEKTIEMHLSRVYRKMGIRSRSELTRVLAPRRDEEPQT